MNELYASGEMTGASCETAIVHHPSGYKAKRMVLAGAGKEDKFSLAEIRKVAGAVLRALKPKGVRSICLVLESHIARTTSPPPQWKARSWPILNRICTKPIPKRTRSRWTGSRSRADRPPDSNRGRILGESQNFTRALINEPANILTPTRCWPSAPRIWRRRTGWNAKYWIRPK